MPKQVSLWGSDGVCSYGQWRHIGVILGLGPPEFSSVNIHRDLVTFLLKEYPEEAGVIVVVKDRSTPSPEVRDALVRLFRKTGAKLQATALVVEASGFAAALQRSAVTALLMASGQRRRVHAYANIPAAAEWLAEKTVPVDVPFDEFHLNMVDVVREFCNREVNRCERLKKCG